MCSRRDFDRPRFGDEQLSIAAWDLEHVSDAVSQQIHPVDPVR